MAEAAEQLVAGTGWLPPLLRTTPVEGEAPTIPAYAVAAE
jgi:ParB family chromosome partitioning protein